MATTDDFTPMSTADSATGWFGVTIGNPVADTSVKFQGTASQRSRVDSTGRVGVGHNTGSTDVSSNHVFMLVRQLDAVELEANNGWSMRLSSNTGGTTNFDDITVGGEDTAKVRVSGFSPFCVNALRDGELVNGTPPAATAVISFSMIGDIAVNSSRETWFSDEVKRGTGITVTAGTVGTPINSDDLATDDTTDGRGQFIDVNGVFYILGRVTIGDITAATASHYTDTLRTWNFQRQPVKNDFHQIEYVGGTGTNACTFGTEVGTGVTASGVGGNFFKTATQTSAPFHITAVDADITVHDFGSVYSGSLYEDHCFAAWQEDNSGPTFADRRRASNIAGGTDTMFPVTEANNDAYYNGDRDNAFYGLEVNLTTLGAGTPTLAIEYHNGTAWVTHTGIVDGTTGLTADGRITWAKPNDWASVSVNAITAFYTRIRIVSGTFSTNPTIDTIRPLFAGKVEITQANYKSVSCLYSGMGEIILGGSTIFRKGTIANSNAGRMGALVWPDVDPATDVIRDIAIIGGDIGILHRPTANRTYNYRNVTITGQVTDKIRIEATLGRLVTINTLEGSTALVAGDLDLSGGITSANVTIVNDPVTTTINVDDNLGVDLNNARVLVRAATGGPRPFDVTVTITRVTTAATVAHTAHGYIVGDKSQIKGITDKTEDNGVRTVVTVPGANTYTYTTTNSGSTSYTGTIKDTAVFIDGLTAGAGTIADTRSFTSSQPISGFIRKSSASPRFKTFNLAGNTINNTTGLTINARLVLDE